MGAVARWGIQVPTQTGAQARLAGRGRDERARGNTQRGQEAREPRVEVRDDPKGWIVLLGRRRGGPKIWKAGGLCLREVLRLTLRF